jgi:hypothetical protein
MIGKSFGSIFAHKAFAAATPQADPFGITQYGYPANDPIFNEDPETVWEQNNCSVDANNNDSSALTQQWNQAAAANVDPNTEEPVNNTTDPCLLLESAVGATGGVYESSLMSQDDLTDAQVGYNPNSKENVVAQAVDGSNSNNYYLSGFSQDVGKVFSSIKAAL